MKNQFKILYIILAFILNNFIKFSHVDNKEIIWGETIQAASIEKGYIEDVKLLEKIIESIYEYDKAKGIVSFSTIAKKYQIYDLDLIDVYIALDNYSSGYYEDSSFNLSIPLDGYLAHYLQFNRKVFGTLLNEVLKCIEDNIIRENNKKFKEYTLEELYKSNVSVKEIIDEYGWVPKTIPEKDMVAEIFIKLLYNAYFEKKSDLKSESKSTAYEIVKAGVAVYGENKLLTFEGVKELLTLYAIANANLFVTQNGTSEDAADILDRKTARPIFYKMQELDKKAKGILKYFQ